MVQELIDPASRRNIPEINPLMRERKEGVGRPPRFAGTRLPRDKVVDPRVPPRAELGIAERDPFSSVGSESCGPKPRGFGQMLQALPQIFPGAGAEDLDPAEQETELIDPEVHPVRIRAVLRNEPEGAIESPAEFFCPFPRAGVVVPEEEGKREEAESAAKIVRLAVVPSSRREVPTADLRHAEDRFPGFLLLAGVHPLQEPIETDAELKQNLSGLRVD
jgi:hypothetical protein